MTMTSNDTLGPRAVWVVSLLLLVLALTGCGPMGDLQITNSLGMGKDAPIIRQLYVVRAGSDNRRNNLVEDSSLDPGAGIVLLDIAARSYDIHAVDLGGLNYSIANVEVVEGMLTEVFVTPDFVQ